MTHFTLVRLSLKRCSYVATRYHVHCWQGSFCGFSFLLTTSTRFLLDLRVYNFIKSMLLLSPAIALFTCNTCICQSPTINLRFTLLLGGLTLCMMCNWLIVHPFLSFADFFQNQLFRKILSGPSECQTFWTQIRPDILSGLIWVQTVCQGYQPTTQKGKELTLFRPMEFSMKLHTMKSGWSIVYIEESQIIIPPKILFFFLWRSILS